MHETLAAYRSVHFVGTIVPIVLIFLGNIIKPAKPVRPKERVRFHHTGPSWIPGVIVMSIEDGHEGLPGMAQLDPIYFFITIVFNACPTEVTLAIPALRERNLQLHSVQLASADELTRRSLYESSSGSFVIPHRTTAVFVEVRDR